MKKGTHLVEDQIDCFLNLLLSCAELKQARGASPILCFSSIQKNWRPWLYNILKNNNFYNKECSILLQLLQLF